MNQDYQDKDADMHTLFEDIINKKKQPRRSWKNPFSRAKSKKTAAKKPSFAQLDTATQTQRRYQQDVLGGISSRRLESSQQTKPLSRTPVKQTNIVIKVPLFDTQWLKRLFGRYKRLFVYIAGAGAAAILLVSVVSLVRDIAGGPSQPVTTEVENVTPSKVHVPRNMPDGFDVSSGTETLENGAVLYTVHDSKGNQISITQQAKPQDFDQSTLGGTPSFTTRLGNAFIIETTDRITGYIITESTMLLFNSTGAVSNSSLRQVMEAFQP